METKIKMTEFNLKEKRKELLRRFKETPLLDVMPLIIEQDKEFIRLLKEEISIEQEGEFMVSFIKVKEIINKLSGDLQ